MKKRLPSGPLRKAVKKCVPDMLQRAVSMCPYRFTTSSNPIRSALLPLKSRPLLWLHRHRLHTSLQGGTDGPARQERRRDGGTTTPTSSPQNCLPLTVPHRLLYQSHCPSLLPSFTSRLTSRRRCALSLDRTRETGIYICCRSTSSASSSSRSWRARLASPQPLQSRRRYTRYALPRLPRPVPGPACPRRVWPTDAVDRIISTVP